MDKKEKQISSNPDSTDETQNGINNTTSSTDSTYSTADDYSSEANANDNVLDVESDKTLTTEVEIEESFIPSDDESIGQLYYSEPGASKQKRSELNAKEKALLGFTTLFIAAFAASLSFLLSEGYPNKLYSGISLAIFGTAMVVTALVFCCYQNKPKVSESPSERIKNVGIELLEVGIELLETEKSM